MSYFVVCSECGCNLDPAKGVIASKVFFYIVRRLSRRKSADIPQDNPLLT